MLSCRGYPDINQADLGSFVAIEEAELRRITGRIACRFHEPEMAKCMRRQQPPAWRTLDQSSLDQKRLDDFLNRVAWFGETRRNGLDPDRPAAIIFRDHHEIAT